MYVDAQKYVVPDEDDEEEEADGKQDLHAFFDKFNRGASGNQGGNMGGMCMWYCHGCRE